jgi:hypothetical protein
MSSQHAKFLERLRGSNPGRFAFAYWVNSRGFTVEIPPILEAPTAAEHDAYADNGDLFAWKKSGKRLRLEVKTLGITFSSVDDWPYREVFVSNVAAVDRASDVYAWVSVSHDLAFAAIVKATTWETWYKTTCRVSNTGNDETNYAAPLEEVRFISICVS